MNSNIYNNPLVSRYASKDMSFIWSDDKKFLTWRKIWISLAKGEQKLGLNIDDEQIELMENSCDDIDYDKAKKYEKIFRHDVMAHIHTWSDLIPKAKPIIHLGATSCFVGDNTDLILIKESLKRVQNSLGYLIIILSQQADKYKSIPTLAFTHYQPAQLTTVGKRITLWLQDLVIDLNYLLKQIEDLPFRGIKGTTGTQASFLKLFNQDHEKVKQLDEFIAKDMGFEKVISVSGQTYTRKIDYYIVSILAAISSSLHKMAVDIRLLSNLKEVEEPFGDKQIGSSAMAYKRNPMRSERICSLARFVMNLLPNTLDTHSQQWFERTLDDSANRRLVIPQAFLAVDAILNIAVNIAKGFIVNDKVINARLKEELPFMATENIIMEAVNNGGDRQELHEAIRKHSFDVAKEVKLEGKNNNLIKKIREDDRFSCIKDKLDDILNAKHYIGRSVEQVDCFIKEVKDLLGQLDFKEESLGELQV